MSNMYHLLLRSVMVLFLFGAFTATGRAQGQKVEITEGREFYLGIPHCKKPTTEGARGIPIQLWVGSKVDNTVTVEAPAINFSQTHKIKAGKVHIIAIPEGLMNYESERTRPYGISVKSADPVTVTCYISYKVSGEAFAVPAVETLGKKYYALSMWQDFTDNYKPGQILVVATRDNTKVSYMPTADTEKIKAGRWGSVTLQAGDTYLIQAKEQPAYNQEAPTDLSGTYIESTKPIAVFSGHTKGAYPRFSSTMLGTPANFMRNMMFDHMHPVEFLGTEYVFAPIKYEARPPNGQDPFSKDDLIRFVATQDNTNLYVSRPDGTAPKLIKQNMRKGEMYEIPEQGTPCVFTSTHPVAVAQYGKAWRISVVPPIIDPNSGDPNQLGQKKEKPMNPARCGEGMMYALTPISQWASHAIYRSPEGMNNFLNVTFRTDKEDSLNYNGKKFRAVFGSRIQQIPGTPYSYVSTISQAGEHIIEADSGAYDVKFAAYVYGNYDATKDGFAYGYPVGVNYALNLPEDSLLITDKMECGNVEGKVEVIHETEDYAGIFDIRMDNNLSSNYTFTTKPSPIESGAEKAEFFLTVDDPMQDAYGVVYILDRTGQMITRTYSYTAEKVVADPTAVSFGPMAVGAKECREITLTNPTAADVVVQGLELKTGHAEFTIESQTFPFTIPAGQSVTFEVCGEAKKEGEVIDSIRAILTCYKPMIAEVKLQAGSPKVTMTDWNFGAVPVNTERSKEIVITNVSDSDVEVVLNTVAWDDELHFRTEGLLDKLPIVLPKKGSEFRFTVFYKPTVAGVQDSTVAQFTGNTTVIKTYSEWKGIGIDAGPYIIGYDWEKRRMNPASPYPYTEGGFGIAGENASFTVERIEITGDDKAAFTFDEVKFNNTYAGQTLAAGVEFRDIPYTFNPTEERRYEATITIYGKAPNGEVKSATGTLVGIGIQPHIKGDEHNFGSHLVGGAEVPGTVTITSTGTDEPLTVSFQQPYIIGADAAHFRVDETAFDMTQTYVIPANGGTLDIPVLFNPSVEQAAFNAEINFTHDAPEEAHLLLMANSYRVGTPNVTASGYEFEPIYTHTNSDDDTYNGKKQYGRITVRNTGDVDGTIINWVIDNVGPDYVNFMAPNVAPIALPAGEAKPIDGFVFVNPLTVRNDYTVPVTVTVRFNNGDERTVTADLVASAKVLPIHVSIPTNYSVDAGKRVLIDYNIRNLTTTDPLSNAKVTKFHAIVEYNREIIRTEGLSGKLEDAIELGNGTLMDAANGWRVLHAELLPADNGMERLSLEFVNDNNTPLVLNSTADQPLFRFWVRSYIAVEKHTDMPCDILFIDRDFVVKTADPGHLVVNEFCVDESRAIRKRASFGLSSIAPNPVKDYTEITYSVAFDAPTRLVVVNSLGEEVAVLVDGISEPGVYTIPFDATNLAAGTYFYRISSGPYSETKTMNIVK